MFYFILCLGKKMKSKGLLYSIFKWFPNQEQTYNVFVYKQEQRQ